MHYLIRCLDRAGAGPVRAAAMEAHKAYLATRPIDVVLSGPLMTDDGQRTLGSCFIVQATDRAAVERFQAADPLFTAGIWDSVEIHALAIRIDNRGAAPNGS